MPWSIKRRGDSYVVVKKDDGKVVGTHDSEYKAKKHLVALNINVHK